MNSEHLSNNNLIPESLTGNLDSEHAANLAAGDSSGQNKAAGAYGDHANKLLLSAEMDDVMNFAIQQNGSDLVREVVLKNTEETDFEHLRLRVDSDTELVTPFEMGIEKIQAGEELHLKNLKIHINGDYLVKLTERISCKVAFRILLGEEVIAKEEKEIIALAYDQWPGLKYTPELLVSFSLPNHPVILALLNTASGYLDKWTKDPSLSGYQDKDPNRVKWMAAAAYAAIQKKNIIYANPPSSFEQFGQRIRLADSVLEQNIGTCMDMTLLYAACLEAMGLNPVLIFTHGHIFAGVWLVDDSFSEIIMDDPAHLEKRMARGIHEMLVVECTAMNAGHTLDFDMANKIAKNRVADYASFEFAIDVKRARSMGIRPLPLRVMTNSGYAVLHEERKEKDVTKAPALVGQVFDLNGSGEKKEATKQLQWERKLLDLSLRNMLINMRFTKAVVPLIANDLSIVEDALSDGEEFRILPRPENMQFDDDTVSVEALTEHGAFSDFITFEGKHKRLHSLYNEKELAASLTKIYRSAKSSMEENGASTLYLTLGLLRWFDSKKGDKTVRYAPLILVPIDIKRKMVSKGYTMLMRDEDAQLNITLMEFLKQNYEVEIPGLYPLPVDEHGLDLTKIFAIVRHAVLNLKGWDVVEAGFVGNFSFSQFVMWNDIHNRPDLLERNDIVRSLIKGAMDWTPVIPESVNTDEAYLPITADSSQLRAINMAAGGVSFVLHGPPGTGKSQTITAMIANALTKGQTVLFVAEKMAALEVVRERLDELGIGDFCMELHSNKATKKSVLDQLKKVLELGEYGTDTDYGKKIQDIRDMRSSLDAYARKLHEPRAFGKTLRELIDLYETIPDEGTLKFDAAFAARLTQSDLDLQERAVAHLIAAGRGLGHPNGHPLQAVGQTTYSQSIKTDLKELVDAYQSSLGVLEQSAKDLSAWLQMTDPVKEEEWKELARHAKSILLAVEIPEFLGDLDLLEQNFDFPLQYMQLRDEQNARKNAMDLQWNETFLHLDMNGYRAKYEDANKKLFFKNRAKQNLVGELQAFAKANIDFVQIPVLLAEVEVFQNKEKELESKREKLSLTWKQLLEDTKKFNSKEALVAYKNDVKLWLGRLMPIASKIRESKEKGDFAKCTDLAKQLLDAEGNCADKEKALSDLLKPDLQGTGENWMENRLLLCDALRSHSSDMKDWILYCHARAECEKLGLHVVCEAYQNGLEHEKVQNVYRRSIYRAMAISVIEGEPVLNGFTGTGFNEQIAQFKRMDEEFMQLTRDEIYHILTHQIPSSMDSVQDALELNTLRRAISSNGRGISVRTLFDQIPGILSKLCPCMLMSPISVAQYISADNAPFDIVIFDEASQLPTCKAVGVLARGKNAVIVGDPNQMPPTSFFAGNTVDEDNLDIEDLESILDDCLALGMPGTHLKWHYRSRHESLIAFSNHEFYENSMLTFPSVNDRSRKVSMVKADGFFDRKKGRINEGEANAIVEEIKRRYKDPLHGLESVGVVTFNISQQTFIEDLLAEEFRKDPEFDKWANEGAGNLFVKNLENVQGDERDTILFSVAFGPDEDKKLSLNFGPLNKEGGWRRLNVAVSRARSEMVVFTIMNADMIDLRRTKSKGVESLKNFLRFAENGRLQMPEREHVVKSEQGILNGICKELDQAGYRYQRNVGSSKFKIDVAVIHPLREEEYVLGIMLDGDSYKQTANTKDREIAQKSVLERLGWNLHRIWTMDWWDNKEKETAKLLEVLREAV